MVCDACSLLNLLATGRPSDILSQHRILLAPRVLAESLHVYADKTRSTKIWINEDALRQSGLCYISTTLNQPEQISAVRFAALVDDGEAETLAIAKNRSLAILSDDVAAAKIAATEGITVVTTLDLIRNWSHGQKPDEVQDALLGMRARANYAAPRTHHLRAWFINETADRTT